MCGIQGRRPGYHRRVVIECVTGASSGRQHGPLGLVLFLGDRDTGVDETRLFDGAEGCDDDGRPGPGHGRTTDAAPEAALFGPVLRLRAEPGTGTHATSQVDRVGRGTR